MQPGFGPTTAMERRSKSACACGLACAHTNVAKPLRRGGKSVEDRYAEPACTRADATRTVMASRTGLASRAAGCMRATVARTVATPRASGAESGGAEPAYARTRGANRYGAGSEGAETCPRSHGRDAAHALAASPRSHTRHPRSLSQSATRRHKASPDQKIVPQRLTYEQTLIQFKLNI